MYFFKVELTLFDEDRDTLFIVPKAEQEGENKIPLFSESALTSHYQFITFVKRTKTSIVDVAYELYEAIDFNAEDMDKEEFDELLELNKLVLVDSNDFCIQTRKIKYKKSKGKGGMSSLFPKIGIAAAVLLLIVGAVAKIKRKDENAASTTSSTSGVVSSTASVYSSVIEETSNTTEGTESSVVSSPIQSEDLPVSEPVPAVPETPPQNITSMPTSSSAAATPPTPAPEGVATDAVNSQ